MTSRNLNKTWRDVLIQQYRQDLADNAPFPIRYLINVPERRRDLWWEIHEKIEPATFQQSIFAWYFATRGTDTLAYEDQHVKVTARK